MEIINIGMKEINDIIGNKLKENLFDFKFNKPKKQLERNSELKIDIIKWHGMKYIKNGHFIISFTNLIRHNPVDKIYEELFTCNETTKNIIWLNDDKLYGNGNTSFDIKTLAELNETTDNVVNYYKNIGYNFFNQFNNDFDFYKYICVDNKLPVYNAVHGLKRIILCYIVEKNNINKIHKDNMEIGDKKYFSIADYYDGIKILNKYYNEEIIKI
jgi:hypothetical protein